MKKEYLDKIAEDGQLVVVSGPAGTGKRTVLQEYLKDHERACISIPVTTREQKKDEVDGEEYWFVSVAEFERMIRTGEMLEYHYVGNYGCGTTKKGVEEARAKGKNVILDVDPTSAMKIRTLCPDATLIFILPPSWTELKERLEGTGLYSEEEIAQLMDMAEEDIACANQYDYVLINDNVTSAVNRFAQILHGNRYSRNSMKGFLDSYIEGEIKPHIEQFKNSL
nr:guanylate kinase [uncultured Mediterraneibacter sp.]